MTSRRTQKPARDGLRSFITTAQAYRMLEPEEEKLLAWRVREHEDPAAAREMAMSHLKLVIRIANSFRGYGFPEAEIIAEGNLGLMEALKRYDPGRGARFSTYATWWIRAEIQEYILRSWSLVKIGTTPQQKKLFFGLRAAKARIQAHEEGDLSPAHLREIARRMNVTEQEVKNMNIRLSGDTSLNVMIYDTKREDILEKQDALEDDRPSPEDVCAVKDECDHRAHALTRALETLSPRYRMIFEKRRLVEEENVTSLEKLGEELGISKERARQIEVRAFEKVQAAVLQYMPHGSLEEGVHASV